MIGSWGYYGFCTLIFLAGLQGIDPEIYEAARIDGANAWQRFWSITLPLLRPTLIFVLIYTIIGSMKFFDIIYVATKGGPDNSTQIVAVYMFDLFIRQGDVNYAAAMSVVLTAIILVMSLFVIRNATRRT
jgi:ABC-type sugar transport system permease subunit